MARGVTVLLVLAIGVVGQALTPNSYFTSADVERLRAVFAEAQPYGSDLQALHYSVLGYVLLGDTLQNAQKTCDTIKANVDVNNVDNLFYATSAAANLKTAGKQTCQFTTTGAETSLNNAIVGESTTQTIYHAVAALKNLGLKVDAQKVSTAITEALKTDDAAQSYGYAFLAASHLTGDLTKFHDLIEDVIAQADEVDETYLQFEGGLFTTALVIDASYKLATAAKKAPTLSEEKVIKFANYFLSRKHVHLLKNAVAVLSVIKTLTDNQFHIPIAVTLASQVSVSDKSPTVQIRVSNLLGTSLGKLTVTADTARHVGDDAVVLSKKAFTASAKDQSLYELDFLSVKPARGFYKISISSNPQQPDKRLIGTTGAEVEVKVTTQVTIENVEIGVADKDQSTAAKTTKIQHPNKAANAIEADHHQKIMMKFLLKDKSTGTSMTAHQTFIRLTNQETQQEITFVAEADGSDAYRFDLDVGSSAKDFGYLSGHYNMDLIIGDAVIQNPFSWAIADVVLTFPEGNVAKRDDTYRYSKKPEIEHQFREPEARPPAVVSTLFTVLVLLPVLILLFLWVKIGVNMSSFSFSLSTLGFHVGLAAIFGLYYCYFLTLNMFQTLRWLGILGIPTFLFGNRLLSSIAARRKA